MNSVNTTVPAPKKLIWIDLDNSPHVPFFKPIIQELYQRGYEIMLTARDAFQVCELAERSCIPYARIGRHYGKNRVAKVLGLFVRALQLVPKAMRAKPDIAVSHGSRSQIIAANMLPVPSLLTTDYEHAKFPLVVRPTWVLVPEVIPADAKRIWDRLELHDTPKHGSWLNMAAIELSLLSRQCLKRRLSDQPALQRETTAWADQRNQRGATVG